MMDLDRVALEKYLDDAISTFAVMNGHMDPSTNGNDRIAGALLALAQVRTDLAAGMFDRKQE